MLIAALSSKTERYSKVGPTIRSAEERSRDVLPKINSNGRRVSVHWFAGVLQSLCSPSQVARMTLGEQRRKALELLAPHPSRHDHSIPRQSGQRFEQAFHNRCRKSVEPIRSIECQRRRHPKSPRYFSIWMLLPKTNQQPRCGELSRAVAVDHCIKLDPVVKQIVGYRKRLHPSRASLLFIRHRHHHHAVC
jgi:hypothetical protein